MTHLSNCHALLTNHKHPQTIVKKESCVTAELELLTSSLLLKMNKLQEFSWPLLHQHLYSSDFSLVHTENKWLAKRVERQCEVLKLVRCNAWCCVDPLPNCVDFNSSKNWPSIFESKAEENICCMLGMA